jgi:hypothetical protein
MYIWEPLREVLKKFFLEYKFPKADIEKAIEDVLAKSPYEEIEYDTNTIVRELLNKENLEKMNESEFDNFFNSLHSKYGKKFRYYILCTSGNPDTSSMWSYYVKNGNYQGYNLKIDVEKVGIKLENILENIDIKAKVISGEVIYEKDNRLSYSDIKNFINDSLNKYKFENKEQRISVLLYKIQEILNHQKFFFKNPAFKNEEEFRIILKIPNDFKETENGKFALKYRVGASGIITPYIEWKFAEDNESISEIIKEITLAPMIEEEIAKEGFKRFLADEDIKNIRINQSSIKLRF